MDLKKEYCELNGYTKFNKHNENDYTKFLEQKITELNQALQLQQTSVMPCFSYGEIITDGTYDAKVIENTTIVHSTMVKYLHNDIFDNISGIGWKLK